MHGVFASCLPRPASRSDVSRAGRPDRQDDPRSGQRERDPARDDEARQRREQEKQIENSVIDGRRAIFHRIEPGFFKMGDHELVDVTLTQPFEMMAALTTQIIWKTVAELAYSRFGDKYAINADPSHFKGDTHPVEMVSYDDIQKWLGALNKLSQEGEPVLKDLIQGHKQGDIYRLPMEAEWEFVLRGRGQNNGTYHFGDDVSQLGDYAWFAENSGGQTHPVAQKKPLVIAGMEFYDMQGNVKEWVYDWHKDRLLGGRDPQGPKSTGGRVVRCGGWCDKEYALRTNGFARHAFVPEVQRDSVGFRLVRTAK